LIVAYGLVSILLYYFWPQIAFIIAHGAQRVVLVLNPIPYVGEFSWTEGGYQLGDRIMRWRLYLRITFLPFTLGFPVGFALAMPGLRTSRYWRILGWTIVASVAMCIVQLAVAADERLALASLKFGIEIHAGWHDELLRIAANSLEWDFLMLLYPFVACLLLIRALLTPTGPGASARKSPRPAQRSWLRNGEFAALASLLLLISIIEVRAQQLHNLPREHLLEELAERNADLGKSLIRLGDSLSAEGKHRAALHWYRIASEYDGNANAAQKRMRRLRNEGARGAPPRRDR
jgi:hypothetical protein